MYKKLMNNLFKMHKKVKRFIEDIFKYLFDGKKLIKIGEII